MKGGKMALIGLCKEPLHVDNFLQEILFKSLTLKTIHGRRIFHSWQECEKLIAEKKVSRTSTSFLLGRFETSTVVLKSKK
jgi:threonine 3-dehydrogenase